MGNRCFAGFVVSLGRSKVWYEHPLLENHRNPGGREDGETCAAEEHPDRR